MRMREAWREGEMEELRGVGNGRDDEVKYKGKRAEKRRRENT